MNATVLCPNVLTVWIWTGKKNDLYLISDFGASHWAYSIQYKLYKWPFQVLDEVQFNDGINIKISNGEKTLYKLKIERHPMFIDIFRKIKVWMASQISCIDMVNKLFTKSLEIIENSSKVQMATLIILKLFKRVEPWKWVQFIFFVDMSTWNGPLSIFLSLSLSYHRLIMVQILHRMTWTLCYVCLSCGSKKNKNINRFHTKRLNFPRTRTGKRERESETFCDNRKRNDKPKKKYNQ